MKQPRWTILVGLLACVLSVAWLSRDAVGQYQVGGPKYEYMLLVLDDARPAALAAEQRIEISPPARAPSGRIDDPGVSNTGYSLRTTDTRHASLGALNLLGDQGWEAVAAVPHAKGSAILLKRRVG